MLILSTKVSYLSLPIHFPHSLSLTLTLTSILSLLFLFYPYSSLITFPHLHSNEYLSSFNPIALKDSALSTNKPIEVKGPGGKATIIHAQYNTPISMYSQDAIMDAIAGQSQARGSEMSG